MIPEEMVSELDHRDGPGFPDPMGSTGLNGGRHGLSEPDVTDDAEGLFSLSASMATSVPRVAVAVNGSGNAGSPATGDSGRARMASLARAQSVLLPTERWRAHTFQVINWGGFDGRGHQVRFSAGSTLISGTSGCGKSTLLDAYIALMMPSDISFNGASNDAVTGRARGAEQRNLATYLRGKVDTTADEGQEVDKVLRGNKRATWGAVSMTFTSDAGLFFTALRIYYLPVNATKPVMRMATIEESLDLSSLEALAPAGSQAEKFAPRALKAAFPGMRTYESYAAFAQTLHTRLGIGANGDGEKALRLLARIQAGHQIRTVDALYKEMVLEEPATFAAADRAISHFDDLEAAYTAMVTDQQKVDLLAPITATHRTLLEARDKLRTLDVLGVNESHDATPAGLWRARARARLLENAVEDNRHQRKTTSEKLNAAQAAEQRAEKDLAHAREAHRDAGGAALETLGADIATKESERDRCDGRRAQLVTDTEVLGASLGSHDDFAALVRQAKDFLDALPNARGELRARRDELKEEQYPLLNEQGRLRRERESLQGREGRVPDGLHQMRLAAAKAAGMAVADLPFVAELIDVAPEQARWRTAIETVLFGSARIMLVPVERLQEFSTAIDTLQLRGRLNFEGVESALHRDVVADPDFIAGKLLYKSSPYSHWVGDHVRASARNARCVERPHDLAGNELRVTVSGQTRSGRRGAHGRHDAPNIIGFSNTEAISDLDRDLKAIEGRLEALDRDLGALDEQEQQLDSQRSAYEAIQRTNWEDIDSDSLTRQIEDLKARVQRILAGNDKLAELNALIEQLTKQLSQDLTPARVRLADALTTLRKEHSGLVDAQDETSNALERLEAAQIVLRPEDADWLDQELTAACAKDPWTLSDFEDNLALLARRLISTQTTSRNAITAAEAELGRIFKQYQDRWEDPNLGTTAESYPDYAAILDHLTRTGLHQRRAEWRAHMAKWSGEDLVPLAQALNTAIEEIKDRLDPINDILTTLPFGATGDRLGIRLRQLSPESVTVFRRELNRLSRAATAELADTDTEQRFKALRTFMAKIRPKEDPRLTPELRATWDRQNLLDVRRHVEITAERYDLAGQSLSTYSFLGGKSGGESQELVAFIVGAALRFRLGDETRTRPRFAPVFLDEGFIKSDGEFAGRAVSVWKGLGFQLIVGAPLDKVSALEAHMDEIVLITKNTENDRSYILPLRSPSAATDEPSTTSPDTTSGAHEATRTRIEAAG